MRSKVKLYIISGFLGSGKTTFLKRVLENFATEKLGVLVNEFGVIGVDGTTLRKDGIEYVEVNNGSIFCSCIKANFLKTLISLQKQDIDVLVIENSGLADPSSINGILTELDHLMELGYDYQGSICMVDSSIFLRYVDMLPQLTNQIISSSFIILNKTDLAGAEKIAQIRQRITKLNPNAFVIEAVQADVPISLLSEHLINSGFDTESYNTPQNRTATYTIKLAKKYRKADIETFARGLRKFALRIKGFVNTDQGWVHIDIVENDYRFKAVTNVDDELKSKQGIVIIGKNDTEFDDTVSKLWQQLFSELPEFIEE